MTSNSLGDWATPFPLCQNKVTIFVTTLYIVSQTLKFQPLFPLLHDVIYESFLKAFVLVINTKSQIWQRWFNLKLFILQVFFFNVGTSCLLLSLLFTSHIHILSNEWALYNKSCQLFKC